MGGHNREHHYSGGMSNKAPQYAQGGRTKRQHHYWGQDFFGRIPGIGNLAASASKNAGTFDQSQYGGNIYNQKQAEAKQDLRNKMGIAYNAVGNKLFPKQQQPQPQAGAPVANNLVRQPQKRGGRSKNHHKW